MLQDYETGNTQGIRLEPGGPDNLARDRVAAEAFAALKELDAHGNAGIPLLLQFGKALSNAKAVLKRGEFSLWCLNVLKRSPSWCSAHRRLYQERRNLEPARAWAEATEHRWANCHSVERLLKIIADWKIATHGACAMTPRRERKKQVIAASDLDEIAARLRELFADARHAFENIRYELWLTTSPDERVRKEELVALGKRIRSRLHQLAESCSALQLSTMAEPVPDDLPHVDDAPEAGLPQ
jgi:hypothetical protein